MSACEMCGLPIWMVEPGLWSHYGDISEDGTDHAAEPPVLVPPVEHESEPNPDSQADGTK